tara:strand:+ start:2037 stop:2624 length:588 start_codon:yes stop_codon:yes gene_type:complete
MSCQEEKEQREKMSKKKRKTNEYINNKDFYAAMVEWKKQVTDAEAAGEPRPPVSEYIGKCFLDIAEHLSFKPNFMNYAYKEEMIGDGVENCLMYCHNFDPDKSTNPFSYFTQIIYYAFLRRIEREKKQSYIKYKALEMNDTEGLFKKYFTDNYFESENQAIKGLFNLSENDIEKFTPKKKKKRSKKSSNEDSTDK